MCRDIRSGARTPDFLARASVECDDDVTACVHEHTVVRERRCRGHGTSNGRRPACGTRGKIERADAAVGRPDVNHVVVYHRRRSHWSAGLHPPGENRMVYCSILTGKRRGDLQNDDEQRRRHRHGQTISFGVALRGSLATERVSDGANRGNDFVDPSLYSLDTPTRRRGAASAVVGVTPGQPVRYIMEVPSC